MSEQKLHYFDFYFQRFIASTKGWTDEEVGAYMKLLIEQADRGYIPTSPAELSRLITSYKRTWPLLKKKFKAGDHPGQLQNGFMVEVREAALRKVEANRENGKKGGRPRKKETQPKATGFENKTDGLATANPTGNPTETQLKAIPVTSNQYPDKEKNKKENSFPCTPGPDIDMALLDGEISVATEFIFRIKQVKLSVDRVTEFWKGFCLNLSGQKYYHSRGELVQHFRNWLKDQKIEAMAAKADAVAAPPLKRLSSR